MPIKFWFYIRGKWFKVRESWGRGRDRGWGWGWGLGWLVEVDVRVSKE